MPTTNDPLLEMNKKPDTAPLEMFLRAATSGATALTPEMYEHFGGDEILKQLQKYDPDAKWVDSEIGAGEGGSQGMGKRLVYDINKLPKSQRGMAGFDLNPADLHDKLKNPHSLAEADPIYGSVRNSGEFAGDNKDFLEKALPYIAMALTMGGGALAAAPAMAGVAGGTAAVTGEAAGLAASNIAMGGASNLLSNIAAKAPQILRSQSNGGSLLDLAGSLAGASGVPYAQYLKPLLSLVSGMTANKPATRPDPQLQALLQLVARKGP